MFGLIKRLYSQPRSLAGRGGLNPLKRFAIRRNITTDYAAVSRINP